MHFPAGQRRGEPSLRSVTRTGAYRRARTLCGLRTPASRSPSRPVSRSLHCGSSTDRGDPPPSYSNGNILPQQSCRGHSSNPSRSHQVPEPPPAGPLHSLGPRSQEHELSPDRSASGQVKAQLSSTRNSYKKAEKFNVLLLTVEPSNFHGNFQHGGAQKTSAVLEARSELPSWYGTGAWTVDSSNLAHHVF